MATLLEAGGGPAVNRINLDELDWEPFDDLDGRYRGEIAEIGLLLGARRLGYRAVRLPSGARFCPLHAHDREEEVFYVVEGAPVDTDAARHAAVARRRRHGVSGGRSRRASTAQRKRRAVHA